MTDTPVQIVDVEAQGKPRRFVFVLLDQFTLLCYSCAVESLRIANRMAGQTLYDWRVIGEGGDHHAKVSIERVRHIAEAETTPTHTP